MVPIDKVEYHARLTRESYNVSKIYLQY